MRHLRRFAGTSETLARLGGARVSARWPLPNIPGATNPSPRRTAAAPPQPQQPRRNRSSRAAPQLPAGLGPRP